MDLIPDFVPVLGLLDDLILVPAGLWLARSLIPPDLLAEFRAAADARRPPPSKAAAAAVIAVWLAGAATALWAVASVV
ncbi:MAG: YkvA family protein [Tagaea sp.]